VQHRIDMLGEIGTGIDDRDLAMADDIGAGAVKRKGPGLRATMRRTFGDTVSSTAYSNVISRT
jgi:hypothetical protein